MGWSSVESLETVWGLFTILVAFEFPNMRVGTLHEGKEGVMGGVWWPFWVM